VRPSINDLVKDKLLPRFKVISNPLRETLRFDLLFC